MADDGRRQTVGAAPGEVVVEMTPGPQQGTDGGGGRDNHRVSPTWASTTVFEPNGETGGEVGGPLPGSSSRSFSGHSSRDAPEKKLTLFALRLAVLEKAASSLGTLGFIWATVVLLGGFAITLDTVDFWVVTTILVIEGARIFSRSHELEWQHQATRSIDGRGGSPVQRILQPLTSRLRRRSTKVVRTTSSIPSSGEQQQQQPQQRPGGSRSRRSDVSPTRRAWKSSEVPLVPYAGWLLDTGSVSRMLYWLQLLSASTCVALSLMRLSQQSFGEIQKGDTDKRNRKAALNIFYGLALAEALLFLVEKLYCEFEINVRDLLVVVSRECGLGDTQTDLVPIRRFFYDAFSRCIDGSVFDGAKMELVSFAEELLGSDSRDEQLIGARILCQFAGRNDESGRDTLRKIGTSTATMERLVEMLNWRSPSETDLRRYAAEVVSRLASKKQNVLRVAAIPGAMESIASLLQNSNMNGHGSSGNNTVPRPHELRISGTGGVPAHWDHDQYHYDYRSFNLLGLGILKKLAHNHDNCGKIGNTRDLLPRILHFTAAEEWLLVDPSCHCPDDEEETKARVKAAKRSLQLLQMLANSSGMTGQLLRREIANIVFTVGYMRDIIRHGGKHKLLQKLAIEILTCLALDADTKDRIGATGGVVRDLFHVFFAAQGGCCTDEQQRDVGREAGEALALLALESPDNCRRMLRLEVVDRLTVALSDPELCVSAGRILTYLCANGDSDSFPLLRGVTKAAPSILRTIIEEEKKPLEVSAGLALQIFRLMSLEETEHAFREAGIKDIDFVETLIRILQSYSLPSVREPRIRKYTVELMIWMMKPAAGEPASHIIDAFKTRAVEKQLQNVEETTSELELYNVFSGSAGLSRHGTTIESLVETAMALLSGASEFRGPVN